MQKIIVPVDFSTTSSSALRYATYLAEIMDLDLTVVHVFDPNFTLTQAISTGATRAEKERLEAQLNEFVEQHAYPVMATFQGNLSTLPAITTEVIEGFASAVIRELSARMDVGLMVMGGVGSGKVSTPPDIFGRVARGVALHGQCPVILIPTGYGFPTVNNLAIAFKEQGDIKQIQAALQPLLMALRPRVSLVHVEDSSDKRDLTEDETFLAAASGLGLPKDAFFYATLPAGPVVKRLLEYVEHEGVGMLVLGGKRRSFWEGLFTGSSLRPLVNRCEVPVLIIPLS